MRSSIKKNLRVTVYALSSSAKPDTVCYIGQTSVGLEGRLGGHIRASTARSTPVAVWIRNEISRGREILIQVLEKNAPRHIAEKRWIALFSASGAMLRNCNSGGGGRPQSLVAKSGQARQLRRVAPLPAAVWPFPTSSRP